MHSLWFSILFYFLGCRHQIQIQSTPVAADVYWQNDFIGTTPLTTTFWWYPGRRIKLDVRYKTYRSVGIPIHSSINPAILTREFISFRWKTMLGLTTRAKYNVLLIKEHGPAGTWTPEDAKELK